MMFYVHSYTIEYTDYGSHLQTCKGIVWSHDGETRIASTYREGATVEEELARCAEVSKEHPNAKIEFRKGKALSVTCDMNPRGLI